MDKIKANNASENLPATYITKENTENSENEDTDKHNHNLAKQTRVILPIQNTAVDVIAKENGQNMSATENVNNHDNSLQIDDNFTVQVQTTLTAETINSADKLAQSTTATVAKPTLGAFVKKNLMPIIALLAATVTCFFVPIDDKYLGYFDFGTLATLFCTLTVVAALKNIRFFTWLAKRIVLKLGTLRNAFVALVFITYFGSMIMANDMALITFLPLGYVALSSCNRHDKMPLLFVMQNVAANLGGMLTPFGNPQNLYLFGFYQSAGLDVLRFTQIMLPPFVVALVMILAVCLTVPKDKIQLYAPQEKTPSAWRTTVYALLFVLSIMIVFDVFTYIAIVGVVAVVVSMLILDRKALAKVDYALLITFGAFFVFSGNLARIEGIQDVLGNLVNKSPLLIGVASCQFISNVPTAVLLSNFTNDFTNLLVAVNIGGLGTPIASLASLITLNEFRKHYPDEMKKYLATFLTVNFGFLAVLIVSQLIVTAL